MSACEHLVEFYETEDQLVDAVVPYLADGISADESVIVIATEPHRIAFEERLMRAGVSVGAALTAGTYTALDAAEILRYLQSGDGSEPSAADFDATIGVLMRRHCAGGRRVRAYGEIVALLWDAGDVAGAVALEEMWNHLQAQEQFTLFCGYPGSTPARLEAVRSVCRAHSSVLPSISELGPHVDEVPVRAEFTADLGAPGRVRALVRSVLRDRSADEDLIERGTLAASELATNAVVHAHTPFRLLVKPMPTGVWIGVEDGARLTDRHSLAGRSPHGLGLVAALALRWGVRLKPTGKVVWAEIPHQPG